MIRHVVLFTWNADATEAEKAELSNRLSALPGLIPEMRAYKFGGDIGENPGNADFCVVADFDDLPGYRAYRDHPAHRAVIDECITPIVATRTAIQLAIA